MRQRHAVALLVFLAVHLPAAKFYPDDPLEREPTPVRVEKVRPRKINDVYDLFSHTFSTRGERHPLERSIPAMDVNTLGEVIDGAWYQARHGRRRMTVPELVAGPGDSKPPSEGPWTVVSAKTEGIT